MQFFRIDELRCSCGCGRADMDHAFLGMLDGARGNAGIPFVITSGFRCEDHNRAVGSTSTNHTRGVAADIRCTDGPSRYRIVRALLEAGFRRIGVHGTFIHADINRGPDSIWLY